VEGGEGGEAKGAGLPRERGGCEDVVNPSGMGLRGGGGAVRGGEFTLWFFWGRGKELPS